MPDSLLSAPARAAALLAAALLLAPAAAHAYIDPGTGSFVIQGVIAAVVGAGVALKMFWGRITGALGGKRRPADDDDDA
ncbi:MAG: hypothetical protein R6X35_15995 [Candidatus Krumholzibacteriia bacterium]